MVHKGGKEETTTEKQVWDPLAKTKLYLVYDQSRPCETANRFDLPLSTEYTKIVKIARSFREVFSNLSVCLP